MLNVCCTVDMQTCGGDGLEAEFVGDNMSDENVGVWLSSLLLIPVVKICV